MTRTCSVCLKMADARTMKRIQSTSKTANLIVMGILSLLRVVDKDEVDEIVDRISQRNRYICSSHIIQAAKYVCAEITASGRRLSYCEDVRPGKIAAFFTTTDIPAYLVDVINHMSKITTITARDVWSFVNEALSKYYGTPMWPEYYEEQEASAQAQISIEAGETASSDPTPDLEVGPHDPDSMREECEENDELDNCADCDRSGSEYYPDSSDEDDRFIGTSASKLKTKPADLKRYYLVQGSLLLSLFRFCPECGLRLGNKQLRAVGTAAVVRYVCESCSLRRPAVKKWESQERAVDHKRERMYKGNVAAAVSAITTGLRYVELHRWCEQLDLALFGKTFFYKILGWTKPAIESVYRSHQRLVIEEVKNEYEEGEGLHLAADGAYDSRGYSALIGKVVLSEARTKLILHTEVLHRSETDNISTRMEVAGLRRVLQWMRDCGLLISSVTTDRSRALGAALRGMEPELGVIRHYYDGWHLAKWLGNELRKKAKEKECEEIALWTEKAKTHLWTAVEQGHKLGADPRPIFNTCLMHVLGVHHWPEDERTGPYTSCSHAPMGPRPEDMSADSKAYEKFREVVLTKSFQRDLVKASPHGGTSICEAKNALDRIYCRKEIFYPMATYPMYCMMATMHMNTLRLADKSGKRKVLRECVIKRKYLNRTSKLILKSQPKHSWRDEVLDEVLKVRLMALESKSEGDIPQWVADLIDEEDYYDSKV